MYGGIKNVLLLVLGDNDNVLKVFVRLHEIEPLIRHLIVYWMFPLLNIITRYEKLLLNLLFLLFKARDEPNLLLLSLCRLILLF